MSGGAVLSNSPSPPTRVGITGRPAGPLSVIGGASLTAPSSEICDTPVNPPPSSAAVVPCRPGTPSLTPLSPAPHLQTSGHPHHIGTGPSVPSGTQPTMSPHGKRWP